jgi:hypothetical protein
MSARKKRGAAKSIPKMNRMERRIAAYDADRARREKNYERKMSLCVSKLVQKWRSRTV